MSASSCISFVGIVDFSEQAHWLFLSESVSDLLGYEPSELVNTPSLDLAHPDEIEPVRKLHYDTITQDKAAALVYMRLRHKDPYRGYILCAITRTITYNVVVGSVSYASTGPKAMHNASTAQEVTVITPSARKGFEFRRWGDPSPMHPTALSDSEDGESTASDASDTEKEEPIDSKSPTDGPLPDCQQRGPPVDRDANGASSPTQSPSPPTQTSEESGSSPRSQSSGDDSVSSDNSPRTRNPSQSRRDPSLAPVKVSRRRRPPRPYVDEPAITYAPLPKQSMRTALFLDRFSRECKIEYCSNDNFVQTTQVMGRPFFDFVMKKDEELVRSWIEAVKAWGVNERGQPSDGGFGYGKFTLYLPGRNSSEQDAEQNRGRHRRGSRGAGISDRQERRPSSHSAAPRPSSARPHLRGRTRDEMRVDAIFSAYSDGLMVIIRHAKH